MPHSSSASQTGGFAQGGGVFGLSKPKKRDNPGNLPYLIGIFWYFMSQMYIGESFQLLTTDFFKKWISWGGGVGIRENGPQRGCFPPFSLVSRATGGREKRHLCMPMSKAPYGELRAFHCSTFATCIALQVC